jgi:hypothetical protein
MGTLADPPPAAVFVPVISNGTNYQAPLATLLLAIGGILLIVVALASPWMGTVKASGLGANLEIEGTKA